MSETLLWKDKLFWAALVVVAPFYFFLFLFVNIPVTFKPEVLWSTTFLTMSLLFPVVEEIIFRGLVQEKLSSLRRLKSKKLWQLSYANILTSVIFCALHFFNQPPVWAISIFFPSLVFGFFKDRYHVLRVPIFLHVYYNASYFALFGID